MSSKQMILPRLIGFCGYARSGKNTAAEELNKLLNEIHTKSPQNKLINYITVGFADTLKGDIKPCIDFAKSWGVDTTTTEFKELFRPMWVLWSRVAKFITNDKYIWVKRLFQVVDQVKEHNFAICDVRYDYEVAEIINRGGVVFFIKRDNITFANDEEEESFKEIFKAYAALVEEFTIENNSTKRELGVKVFNKLVSK